MSPLADRRLPAEQQQRVDQLGDAVGARPDRAHPVARTLGERGVLREQLAAGLDRGERRAQLVADVGGELLLARHQGGDAAGVLVERAREREHLAVPIVRRERRVPVAGIEVDHAPREVGDLARQHAREPDAQAHERDERGAEQPEQPVLELVQPRLVPLDVVAEEVVGAALVAHRHVQLLPVEQDLAHAGRQVAQHRRHLLALGRVAGHVAANAARRRRRGRRQPRARARDEAVHLRGEDLVDELLFLLLDQALDHHRLHARGPRRRAARAPPRAGSGDWF